MTLLSLILLVVEAFHALSLVTIGPRKLGVHWLVINGPLLTVKDLASLCDLDDLGGNHGTRILSI